MNKIPSGKPREVMARACETMYTVIDSQCDRYQRWKPECFFWVIRAEIPVTYVKSILSIEISTSVAGQPLSDRDHRGAKVSKPEPNHANHANRISAKIPTLETHSGN